MGLDYLLPPLIAFVLGLTLSFIVLRSNYRSPVHRLFAGSLLSAAFWGLVIFGMRASPDLEHALPWDKAVIPLAAAGAALYLHFSVRYTDVSFPRWLILLAYLAVLLLGAVAPTSLLIPSMQVKSYGYAPVPGTLFFPALLLQYLWLSLAGVNLIRGYKKATAYEERNRFAYLLAALLLFLLLTVFDLLPLFGFPLYPGAIIGNAVFCSLTAFAILKYNLLDIHIVIRKGTAYALMSTIVALFYVGTIFVFTHVFGRQGISVWVYLMLLIILALALQPLWLRVQRLVDRWFYRERYDHLKALETFSWHTQSLVDSTKLGPTMVDRIARALRASTVCLLLPSRHSDDFATAYFAGVKDSAPDIVLGSQSPLVKWLKRSNNILSDQDLDTIPQLQSVIHREREKLQKMGAKLILPLKTRPGQLSGVLILGQKLSEQPYTIEDKQLIYALTSQMAINLENARLYNNALRARKGLETWLNSMSDCVMIVNADFTVQFMNKAAIESFGNRNGEICWSTLGKETECSSCPIQRHLYSRGEESHHVINVGDKEYEVVAAPLLNADGSLSVIEVLRDITERRQMEGELMKIERLESIGTLAGGIAHDFNNILTGIMGNIGLARRYVEPKSKAEKRLLEAEKASLRARDLTQQLLTFARGGAPIKKLVSIDELIQDSATFALRGSNVRCEFSIPDDLWSAEVDEGQVNQVITNLVINADEAMPEGGILNIGVKDSVVKPRSALPLPKGDYIEITIEDHGVGISKEHLQKIFDPYFTTKQKGSGLGLATAYSIIKQHDGLITAESTPFVGTTFHIYLHASKKPVPKKEEAAPVEEALITPKGRVLVMDDEEIIQQLLDAELTDVGYHVELAKDGAEAIERYAKAKESGQPFDAVILDLTVPGGIGGKEVVKKLLEIDPSVKAIVSSGYSTDPIMSDFKDYGFSGVAAKPYRIAELQETLRNVIMGMGE